MLLFSNIISFLTKNKRVVVKAVLRNLYTFSSYLILISHHNLDKTKKQSLSLYHNLLKINKDLIFSLFFCPASYICFSKHIPIHLDYLQRLLLYIFNINHFSYFPFIVFIFYAYRVFIVMKKLISSSFL